MKTKTKTKTEVNLNGFVIVCTPPTRSDVWFYGKKEFSDLIIYAKIFSTEKKANAALTKHLKQCEFSNYYCGPNFINSTSSSYYQVYPLSKYVVTGYIVRNNKVRKVKGLSEETNAKNFISVNGEWAYSTEKAAIKEAILDEKDVIRNTLEEIKYYTRLINEEKKLMQKAKVELSKLQKLYKTTISRI